MTFVTEGVEDRLGRWAILTDEIVSLQRYPITTEAGVHQIERLLAKHSCLMHVLCRKKPLPLEDAHHGRESL
jgi:hypothetical protein